MPLLFTTGDLLTTRADIRINTVNCVGVMGAGLALAFKTKYPVMFRDYQKACKAGQVQPGQLHVWRDPVTNEQIVNFPTKRHWRQPSRYEDIEVGLVALRAYLQGQGGVSVALPALGAGHGGLEWNKVKQLISMYLSEVEAEIHVFAPLDSRAAGHHTNNVSSVVATEQMAANGIMRLTPGEQQFPVAIARSMTTPVYVKGDPGRLLEPLLAVFPSAQPELEEVTATNMYLEHILRPGVTVLLGYGAAIERPIIRMALRSGAGIVVYIAETLGEFRVRKDLQDVWDETRITVISIAKPAQHWSAPLALHTRQMALLLSRVALITDPDPDWFKQVGKAKTEHNMLFYLAYHDRLSLAQASLAELGATSLATYLQPDAKPVATLLQALAVPHGDGDELDTTQVVAGDMEDTEQNKSSGHPALLVEQPTFDGPEFAGIVTSPTARKRRKRT